MFRLNCVVIMSPSRAFADGSSGMRWLLTIRKRLLRLAVIAHYRRVVSEIPLVAVGDRFCVLRADFEKFFQFVAAQGAGRPKLARSQDDFGVMLYGFHSHISAAEIFTIGDHAVVGHQDGVMERNEGAERVAEFHGAGG